MKCKTMENWKFPENFPGIGMDTDGIALDGPWLAKISNVVSFVCNSKLHQSEGFSHESKLNFPQSVCSHR